MKSNLNNCDKNNLKENICGKFYLIKKEYEAYEKELREKFLFVVRDTEKGIWGASDLENVFNFFKTIGLDKYKKFLDIGCGDGRIVLVASLFTNACGIEIDKDLINKANEIKNKLKLNAEFICDDFYKHNFGDYELIFINPDTGFYNGLEDKLIKEMKGILVVYNNIFLPRILNRGKTYWFNQTPITVFTK